MGPCRGRRRGQRWITEIPETRRFEPEGEKKGDDVLITLEELEAIRLVDLLELQQQEAALYMGVSRKAHWNDLRSGRKKIASALVYGLGIRIEGEATSSETQGHSRAIRMGRSRRIRLRWRINSDSWSWRWPRSKIG